MPIGSYSVQADLMYELLITKQRTKIKFKSILDLGIGFGSFAPNYRNHIDLGYNSKTIIEGVEGFRDYETSNWGNYDKVYIDDVVNFEPDKKYDLIVCNDVIEHLTKEQGFKLLDKVKGWVNKGGYIYFSTPAQFHEQGAVYGNELEIHKSLWSVEDFKSKDFQILRGPTPCKYTHSMLLAKFIKL